MYKTFSLTKLLVPPLPMPPLVPNKIIHFKMVMDWREGTFYHNWFTTGQPTFGF